MGGGDAGDGAEGVEDWLEGGGGEGGVVFVFGGVGVRSGFQVDQFAQGGFPCVDFLLIKGDFVFELFDAFLKYKGMKVIFTPQTEIFNLFFEFAKTRFGVIKCC